MVYAACAGMAPTNATEAEHNDIFFPPPGKSNLSNKAKAICAQCPVIAQCEDWKERSGARHGVFAGKIGDRGRKI